MMIVVPALTGCQQRQPKAIPASIVRSVSAPTNEMTKRIHGKGNVIERRRTAKETNNN